MYMTQRGVYTYFKFEPCFTCSDICTMGVDFFTIPYVRGTPFDLQVNFFEKIKKKYIYIHIL